VRVLLLSAYDAASHRAWREGLATHLTDVDWRVLTLPPRHFAWRIRGNPLSWWGEDALDDPPDRILATSMVDLATLLGLAPALAAVPRLLYLHENQFAYPASERAGSLLEAQMVQLYAALAADGLLFNSEYNRRSFLDGVTALLKRFPDQVPSGITTSIEERSDVLAVGLDPTLFAGREPRPDGPLRLVWNHRWEHDKAPERLLAFLDRLAAAGREVRVDVLGQAFRNRPAAFEVIAERHRERLGRFGFEADRAAYVACLRRADIVLSTARHDFQGLAVQEAVACGCRPLVPDRLAYVEQYDAAFRYASHLDDPDAEAQAMVEGLDRVLAGPPPDLGALSWRRLAPAYAERLASLSRRPARGSVPGDRSEPDPASP